MKILPNETHLITTPVEAITEERLIAVDFDEAGNPTEFEKQIVFVVKPNQIFSIYTPSTYLYSSFKES